MNVLHNQKVGKVFLVRMMPFAADKRI